MCNDIIEKNIDIYSDRNYGYLNLWTLFRYDEEKIVNYLNKVLNSNNIFRFLKDLVTRSNGTGGYGYSISQKNIEILSKREKIDELINKSKKSLSEDEKLLIEIYEKSKVENEIHDNSIYTNEFIEFKKI